MTEACEYCGGNPHQPTACPEVKSIEFFPDGRIKRLEKHDRRATASVRPTTSANGGTSTVILSFGDPAGDRQDKEEPH